mmetsp:Transcript_42226/g.96925  ORF Transcript_42226/g.96925 Transcript_42226/m.96925 type:complete len:239 (-) Transcript_42226:685-1401(-)
MRGSSRRSLAPVASPARMAKPPCHGVAIAHSVLQACTQRKEVCLVATSVPLAHISRRLVLLGAQNAWLDSLQMKLRQRCAHVATRANTSLMELHRTSAFHANEDTSQMVREQQLARSARAGRRKFWERQVLPTVSARVGSSTTEKRLASGAMNTWSLVLEHVIRHNSKLATISALMVRQSTDVLQMKLAHVELWEPVHPGVQGEVALNARWGDMSGTGTNAWLALLLTTSLQSLFHWQ